MEHAGEHPGPPPAELVVRPTEDGDDVARFGPSHAPDADAPRRRRSLVALLDGCVVGVTTGVESVRHPSHYQVGGAVDEEHHGRGIGTRLLDALSAQLADRPLLVTVPRDFPKSRAFLSARGFSCIARSWTGRINPDHALTAEGLPEGFRVEARDTLDDDVVELYEELYRECHWWIAPYVREEGEPAWIHLAGPFVPGTVTVALDPFDRLIGVTSLHTGRYADDVGGDVFMPPTAILHGGRRREARTLMAHLVSTALDTARTLGAGRVVVEVDDAHVELARVLGPVTAEAVTTTESWANG